jgi:hypothetical protein
MVSMPAQIPWRPIDTPAHVRSIVRVLARAPVQMPTETGEARMSAGLNRVGTPPVPVKYLIRASEAISSDHCTVSVEGRRLSGREAQGEGRRAAKGSKDGDHL